MHTCIDPQPGSEDIHPVGDAGGLGPGLSGVGHCWLTTAGAKLCTTKCLIALGSLLNLNCSGSDVLFHISHI